MRSLTRQSLQGLWAAVPTSWDQQGNPDAIVTNTLIEMSHFLVTGQPTRPPYYPVSDDLRHQLRESFLTCWADELRDESWHPASI